MAGAARAGICTDNSLGTNQLGQSLRTNAALSRLEGQMHGSQWRGAAFRHRHAAGAASLGYSRGCAASVGVQHLGAGLNHIPAAIRGAHTLNVLQKGSRRTAAGR